MAGPTLMPRLAARRLRAKADLRWAGATSEEIMERLAGRTDSFSTEKPNVIIKIPA